MKISLDLICLGLQKYGGITNYWLELINNLDAQNINFEIIKPKSSKINFDKVLNASIKEEELALNLLRFMPIKKVSGDILHSSYYRLPYKKSTPLITTVYDFVSENRLKNFSSKIHNLQKKNCNRTVISNPLYISFNEGSTARKI